MQDEFVNSCKFVVLGQLLVGIVYEMNMLLGNVLFSVSVLCVGSIGFVECMVDGVLLKCQELVDWVVQMCVGVEFVEQSVDCVLCLVNCFKQFIEGSGCVVCLSFDLCEVVLQVWVWVQVCLSVEFVQFDCDLFEGFLFDGYVEVLWQVLEQLLENVCLYVFCGVGGEICVMVYCNGDICLILEVCDDGLGMLLVDLVCVFEFFFMIVFGQGGSGLGLFVVYSFVSGMLGGSLMLESMLGQGIVVWLDLLLQGVVVLFLVV